jgi:hypothetical protein
MAPSSSSRPVSSRFYGSWAHRARLALRSAILALALTARAHAQLPDAETLYKDGVALRRERHDAEALAAFRRAYSIQPAPRTLAQIGLAEQALGQWVDAEADLQRVLQAKGDAWIDRNRAVLATGLADIQRHLGDLDVQADVPGAELWVNGARVAVLPLSRSLRVETGSVLLEVRARGYAAARRTTFVEPGESAREDVHLVPLVVQAPAEEPAPIAAPRSVGGRGPSALAPVVVGSEPARVLPVDRPLRTASFVLLGAGVLGLATGTYYGVRTLDAQSRSHDACPYVDCPDRAAVRLDQDAHLSAVRSTAWFVAGIAVATAGAGLFWMSRAYNLPGHLMAAHLTLDVGLSSGRAVLGGSW